MRRAIQLDPNYPDALNYLGYLNAEDAVDLEEAKGLIERALMLDPDNGAYLDSLGWVYYQMGQTEQAIVYLEHAAQMLPIDPVVFDHLGDAYFRQRDLKGARRNWEKALELDAQQTEIQTKLNRLRIPEVTATSVP